MLHITTPRTLALALTIALALPAMAQTAVPAAPEAAAQPAPAPEATGLQAAAEIQVSVSRKTVHVRNAQGLTLEVYNLTGVRVATLHIDTPDKQLTLNLDKGLYILRIGTLTRKVQLS